MKDLIPDALLPFDESLDNQNSQPNAAVRVNPSPVVIRDVCDPSCRSLYPKINNLISQSLMKSWWGGGRLVNAWPALRKSHFIAISADYIFKTSHFDL